MTTFTLSGIAIPIENVAELDKLWCVYEHHVPPSIVFVHTCKLIDVFRMKEGHDNSEWLRMFKDGGPVTLVISLVTDDRNEAMRYAITRTRSLNPMPRCNLHGYDMRRVSRRIECSNGKTYNSQAEAALELGLSQSNISKVLKGNGRSVGGYMFAYAKD